MSCGGRVGEVSMEDAYWAAAVRFRLSMDQPECSRTELVQDQTGACFKWLKKGHVGNHLTAEDTNRAFARAVGEWYVDTDNLDSVEQCAGSSAGGGGRTP